MYIQESGFYEPERKSQKLWRFIDFTKYIDLLDRRELYFCRLDNFEDPYEGAFPTNQVEFETVIQATNHVKQFNFVNCWHMNDFESAAMWSIYLKNHNGVAIQTTFEKLKSSFDETHEDIHLSIIKYHDYNQKSQNELINENPWSLGSSGSTINPQIFKRTSFDYERELRAIYIDMPIERDLEKVKKRNLGHGKSIKVNLEKLIEKIYIAPKADTWFKDLVISVTAKYSLSKPIEKSDLYNRPSLK
jgi:hypothetical protein